MPNAPEISARIIQAINEKAARPLSCSWCGTNKFTLTDGYVSLVIQDFGATLLQLGGQALPAVALTCQQCGNTVLLNLITLGLGDLLASPSVVTPMPVAEEETASETQTT